MSQKIASLQGEFVVEFAKSPGGDPLISAKQHVYVSGKAEAYLNVPKIWTHVIQSFERTTLSDLNAYINANKIPKVWVRYGVVAGAQGTMSDWELHTIVSVKGIPSRTADTSHGDFFTMVTADLLYVMQKDERVSSRKGRISGMAETIAAAAGFEKFAVEPTDLDYALIQSFQSDYSFLVDRLIPLAANKESASNYLLFTRGEFFHFHTLNYQLSGFYQFDYGIETNTTTDLSISNLGNDNHILRINGIKLVAYDPLSGSTTNWETKPEREVILSDNQPQRAGTSYLLGHVGQNQLSSLFAESQWNYAIDKTAAFELAFSVDNYPFVGVGDVVNCAIQRGQGDPWEGLYVVKAVHHLVKNAHVVTRYQLVRGEFISQDGVAAQGKKLSTAALDASSLTANTSGGFRLGTGSVVSISDPARS